MLLEFNHLFFPSIFFFLHVDAPSAPGVPVASDIGRDTVDLQWDKPSSDGGSKLAGECALDWSRWRDSRIREERRNGWRGKKDRYEESKRTGWMKEEDEVESDNIHVGVTKGEVWLMSKMKRRIKN